MRDTVYLHERLLEAQRPWEQQATIRWRRQIGGWRLVGSYLPEDDDLRPPAGSAPVRDDGTGPLAAAPAPHRDSHSCLPLATRTAGGEPVGRPWTAGRFGPTFVSGILARRLATCTCLALAWLRSSTLGGASHV